MEIGICNVRSGKDSSSVTGFCWSRSHLINCICFIVFYSMAINSSRSVFERLGKTGCDRARGGPVNKICYYWLAGKCTNNPCRFLHTQAPQTQSTKRSRPLVSLRSFKEVPPKQANTWERRSVTIAKKTSICSSERVKSGSNFVKGSSIPLKNKGETEIFKKTEDKIAIAEKTPSPRVVKSQSGLVNKSTVPPNKSDEGQNKSSWSSCNGFSVLAKLEGHSKDITGIALPCGSDYLYSVSSDRALRVWDCNTGKCEHFEVVPGDIGCLVSEGSWLYLGLENVIKASDLKSGKQLTLNGPFGQIYAIRAIEDMLYAGTQDGTILAWKFGPECRSVELVASMKGHTKAITSLAFGPCQRLYSGSMDSSIRIWDLNSFRCIQTLQGHAAAVTSVQTWNHSLLSCSLDGTVKAWEESEYGEIKLVHSLEEDYGFLALCGIVDAESKPIFLCTCGDNTVRLYDLPLFTERGRIFSKQEVRSIQSGPHGLFFTGDATGELAVWKLV